MLGGFLASEMPCSTAQGRRRLKRLREILGVHRAYACLSEYTRSERERKANKRMIKMYKANRNSGEECTAAKEMLVML